MPETTPAVSEASSKPAILTPQASIFSFILQPLSLILLVAFLLRFFQLGYRSVWYDESFSIVLARQDPATILNGTAHDYHPPLFYLALSLWMKLFGDGIFATRLFSVLLGVLAVWVVYLLAKALFGPKAAWLAASIAALAPFQVLYSQEVRMYSLQTLLGTWLLLTFYRAYRRDSREDWFWFGVAGLLSLYNLYFSIFSLAALDLFFIGAILYHWQAHKVFLRGKVQRWFITQVIVGLLYLPWAFSLINQASRVKHSYWISPPNPLEIFRLLNVFLYNTTNLTVDPPFDLIGLLLAVFLLIFMLQAVRFRLRSGDKGRARRSFETALLLTVWLVPVLIVFVLSYLFTPLYLERSLIACAIPAYVLLARLVTNARRPNLWPLLLGPALALALVSLYFYFFSNEYTVHYDYQSASSYLAQNYQTGDSVVHTNKLSYLPFVYLKAPGPQFVVPEEPGNPHDDLSAETQQAIGLQYIAITQITASAKGRLWLVLTPPQPGQTDYQERTVKGWLDQNYLLVKAQAFYGSTVFLYQPK